MTDNGGWDSGTGWGDPVVGGTVLRRAAVQSPNYVLNVTGWAIRQDGTAQFTGLVIIGGTFTGTNFIINSSGSFFYSSTPAHGNLIASITSASGTDGFSNPYQAGITSYDNTFGGVSQLNGAQLLLFSGVTQVGSLTPGQLVLGASGGPQVKALRNVNLSVSFQNPNSLAAAADVSSVTNLQQVIELPSNDAHESGPPIIGEVVVTYTDGDIALATITLGGAITLSGTPHGYFTMNLAASNNGNKSGGVLMGSYAISGSSLTLTPCAVFKSELDPTFGANAVLNIYSNGIRMTTQGGTNLIPAEETWRAVGTAGNPAFQNSWANFGHNGVTLEFKLLASPDNSVWINGVITGGTAAQVFTLPSSPFSFIPVSTQFIPMYNVTTGACGYMSLDSVTGACKLGGIPLVGADEYWVNGIYSLDG